MSLGPEKIILILVVALIVFGPQRLPDIARQVGAAMRELRKMQDTVRDELEHVLHPDYSPGTTQASAAIEETDHAALPPGDMSPGDMSPGDMSPGNIPSDAADADIADDGFAGPRSFS